MEKNTHRLGVVEDHMPPLGVVGKEMCYSILMLRLQEKKDVDQR
jgi:hypothetical protein